MVTLVCCPTGKSNCQHQDVISHWVTVSWHWPNQSLPHPINNKCQARLVINLTKPGTKFRVYRTQGQHSNDCLTITGKWGISLLESVVQEAVGGLLKMMECNLGEEMRSFKTVRPCPRGPVVDSLRHALCWAGRNCTPPSGLRKMLLEVGLWGSCRLSLYYYIQVYQQFACDFHQNIM